MKIYQRELPLSEMDDEIKNIKRYFSHDLYLLVNRIENFAYNISSAYFVASTEKLESNEDFTVLNCLIGEIK